MKLNLKTQLETNEEIVWTGEQDKNAVDSEFRNTIISSVVIAIIFLVFLIWNYPKKNSSVSSIIVFILFVINFIIIIASMFDDIKAFIKKIKKNSNRIFIVTNKRVILANTIGDIIKEYSKEKIGNIDLLSNSSTYSVIFNVESEDESIVFEDIKEGKELYSIVQNMRVKAYENNIMIDNEEIQWEETPGVNIIKEKYTTAFISIMIVFTVGLIIILFHLNSKSATTGIILFISIMLYSTYVYISSVKEINKYKNIRYLITNRRIMCITDNNSIVSSVDLSMIYGINYTTSRFSYGSIYCSIQSDLSTINFNYLIDHDTPLALLETHMNCDKK